MKQGDILTRKDGVSKHKILGICGEVYFVSFANNYEGATCNPYTKQELEKYFILPKEKWIPKIGEKYFWVAGDGEIEWYVNDVGDKDNKLISLGNCYQTQEEAEVVAEKIKKCFKE